MGSRWDVLSDNEVGLLYYGSPEEVVRFLKDRTVHGRTVSVAATGLTMTAEDYLAMRKLEAVTELLRDVVEDVLRNVNDHVMNPTWSRMEYCKKAAERFTKELS